jgi:hypothetical protein
VGGLLGAEVGARGERDRREVVNPADLAGAARRSRQKPDVART